MILISGSTLIVQDSVAEDAHEGFDVLHDLRLLSNRNESNNPVVMFGVDMEIVYQLLFSANNIWLY